MLKTLCFPVLGNKHVAAVQCHSPPGHMPPGRIRGSTNIQKTNLNLTRETFVEMAHKVLRWKEKIKLVPAESKVQIQNNYILEVCHGGMQQSFHKNTQIGVNRLLFRSIDLETKKNLPRHWTLVPTTRFDTSQCLRHIFLYLAILKCCPCPMN